MTIHPHRDRIVRPELYGVARSVIGREDLTVTVLKPDELPGRAGQSRRSGSGRYDEAAIRQNAECGEQHTPQGPSSVDVHGSFSEYESPAAPPDFARIRPPPCHNASTVCAERGMTNAILYGPAPIARERSCRANNPAERRPRAPFTLAHPAVILLLPRKW